MALGDDLVADDCIQRSHQVLEQECARIGIAERTDGELGQSGQHAIADPRSGCGDERHPFGEQTASYEAEGLCRCLIDPLRIVDDAYEGVLLGRLGEQGQGGEPDEEPVGWRTFAHAEHRRERASLRGGQALDEGEHGHTELMQPAIGDLHLGLDADRTRGAEPLGVLGQIAEQRGLADARLTAEYDGSALTAADLGQELV